MRKSIKKTIGKLFLDNPKEVGKLFYQIYKKIDIGNNIPRLIKQYSKDDYWSIVEKYNSIPENPNNDTERVRKIIETFIAGAVNWKSDKLLYNVGAPVNTYSLIANAIALDANVYNINDGLSGNMLAAERSVIEIMAVLAGVERKKIAGLFTFGGTATNMYAMKVGLSKAAPDTRTLGIYNHKIKFFITEDAHFSHLRSADWLGVGSNNVEIISPDLYTRKSLIEDAEIKIRKAVNGGFIVPTIIINGGTTYDHAIDAIKDFVDLRDRLVDEYNLNYKPHIHVDSVIGWAWLAFNNYNFNENLLLIDTGILDILQEQSKQISEIRFADSWGIDFHKGVGACPIDSSLFIVNKSEDLNFISRKLDPNIKIHQLATNFSFFSPIDYTLETSRAGGSCLSALVMLQTEGLNGIRFHLAQLISAVNQLAVLFRQNNSIAIMNNKVRGYVLMIRLYPQGINKSILDKEIKEESNEIKETIKKINKYNKDFFLLDLKERISKNIDFEYSFSAEFFPTKSGIGLSGLKFYPTSPYFSKVNVKHIYETILNQKIIFDNNIYE